MCVQRMKSVGTNSKNLRLTQNMHTHIHTQSGRTSRSTSLLVQCFHSHQANMPPKPVNKKSAKDKRANIKEIVDNVEEIAKKNNPSEQSMCIRTFTTLLHL